MPRWDRDIAYFSLEIGLDANVPTYSGGLGILAGDTLRGAADTELPYVGVTLLYRGGYFSQLIDSEGHQSERPVSWEPERILREMAPRVSVPIDGRNVVIRAFRLDLCGVSGYVVPVYFLDTDLPENDEAARRLTDRLYAGDQAHRIRQEAVLGIGGRRMLRAIGHDIGKFHMNEGHACFVCVELLSERMSRTHERSSGDGRRRHAGLTDRIINDVRQLCVFTTHTPVEAGHDHFSIYQVREIVGDHPVFDRPDLYGEGETLNTTRLAMNFSSFANAVSQKHGEVSRGMFPGYDIHAITNGVHASTWAHPAMRDLFDRHCERWRRDNADLRLASRIPDESIHAAHKAAKGELLEMLADRTDTKLNPDALTVVFSRRVTEYKRPALLMSDIERLLAIHERFPLQIIYAGKSHPRDQRGKETIATIVQASEKLKGTLPIVFYQDYGIESSKKLVSGADLWLNNPRPPLEASGTSGMKAALNGVPSLSTMDGWWLEGWIEGVTGWAIGGEHDDQHYGDDRHGMDRAHAESLYSKLEQEVAPTFYNGAPRWAEIMRACIALNGSHFTTERMVREYALRAYLA